MSNKTILALLAVIIVVASGFAVAVVLSGDLLDGLIANNEGNDPNETHSQINYKIVTAQELYEDRITDYTSLENETPIQPISESDLPPRFMLNYTYGNFSHGDYIIVRDNISGIGFCSENYTTISFSWFEDKFTHRSVEYRFKGNLTDAFELGDTVEIKLHIKHVDINTSNWVYHLDVFDEQWVSKEYFNGEMKNVLRHSWNSPKDADELDSGFKPLNPDVLTKTEES